MLNILYKHAAYKNDPNHFIHTHTHRQVFTNIISCAIGLTITLFYVRLLIPLQSSLFLKCFKKIFGKALLKQHFSLSTDFFLSCWRAFYTYPSMTGSTVISNGLDLMSVNLLHVFAGFSCLWSYKEGTL